MLFRKMGAPPSIYLVRTRRLMVRFTSWNHIAGCKRWGPFTLFHRNRKWILMTQLQPFGLGRRTWYLGVYWGR
jgi:hypothetical protein